MEMKGSWKTTILGYGVIVVTVAQQLLADEPIPQNWQGWLAFGGKLITGVALTQAKDYDKTNAVHATADAKPVPETK